MSLLFSTTPHPSSQEEGTTGCWRADTGVCPYGWVFHHCKRKRAIPICSGLPIVRVKVLLLSYFTTIFLPFWM